jgi:hypothetical protein
VSACSQAWTQTHHTHLQLCVQSTVTPNTCAYHTCSHDTLAHTPHPCTHSHIHTCVHHTHLTHPRTSHTCTLHRPTHLYTCKPQMYTWCVTHRSTLTLVYIWDPHTDTALSTRATHLRAHTLFKGVIPLIFRRKRVWGRSPQRPPNKEGWGRARLPWMAWRVCEMASVFCAPGLHIERPFCLGCHGCGLEEALWSGKGSYIAVLEGPAGVRGQNSASYLQFSLAKA